MPSTQRQSSSDGSQNGDGNLPADSQPKSETSSAKLTAEQKSRLLRHFAQIQKVQKELGLESDGPRNR